MFKKIKNTDKDLMYPRFPASSIPYTKKQDIIIAVQIQTNMRQHPTSPRGSIA